MKLCTYKTDGCNEVCVTPWVAPGETTNEELLDALDEPDGNAAVK